MGSFFKMFFASLLALFIFCVIGFFLLAGLVSALSSKDKPEVAAKTVLTIDLSEQFSERMQNNPLAALSNDASDIPGLFDVVRLIGHAKTNDNIKGILLISNGNSNGFAASEEIRNALLDFRSSNKFVIAHGEMMTENAYYVASAASRLYANPVGSVEWDGFNVSLAFLKGTLDKLEIQPQIFYAGKFKSATEPFRTTQMTPENKLQTLEWLGDMYQHFLVKVSESRKIDTATLHQLANTGAIQEAADAFRYKLVDSLKYDDQVKDEIKKNLGIGKQDKLNLMTINKYAEAVSIRQSGKDRIALIYAEGNIVDGEGNDENIASANYIRMIRKARLDKNIKAIVLRINSGGGSALASENIWRELTLAKAEKPLVVSFGDVAASGGYYIAAAADSIFAQPNTITGSIGVFGIIPNMQGFFNNKLGVTFDGVKTAEHADGGVYRPMTEAEKKFAQEGVDRVYMQFKQRVAQGRKMDINMVDSLAQGRVWSGYDALRLRLVDKLGGLQDAINCAARLAKTSGYRLREFPERKSFLDELLGKTTSEPTAKLKEQVGEENYKLYKELVQIRQMTGNTQARLPFQFFIH
ncbi:MAG TPA: signal peptide peptidase SppA [Flavisolibacter sp.]|nr:signal peptide peptidase SppA [Flavisolibacter sp.]